MLEGLPARVFRRCPLGLAARNLDVVAVNPVVADLEAGDAGAYPLPLFEVVQVCAGVVGEASMLVQLGIESGGDDSSVAQHYRGSRHDCLLKEIAEVGKGADLLEKLGQKRGVEPVATLPEAGEGSDALPKLREVAGTGGTQRNPREDALDVADFAKSPVQELVASPDDKCVERLQSQAQHLPITQRAQQPAPQQPASHCGRACVENSGERSAAVSRTDFRRARGCAE